MANGVRLNGRAGPVTLGIFLIVQFGTAMWWASGVSHDIGYIKEELSELKLTMRRHERGDFWKSTQLSDGAGKLRGSIRC